MKLDSRIYRIAANNIKDNKYNRDGISYCCCFAIKDMQYEIEFHKLFLPKNQSRKNFYFGYLSEYDSDKYFEQQLSRQLALDLIAEMLEQGDL